MPFVKSETIVTKKKAIIKSKQLHILSITWNEKKKILVRFFQQDLILSNTSTLNMFLQMHRDKVVL